MSAGSVIAEILVGAARGAIELRSELEEAERAELDAAIEQVRQLVDGVPVRTGPGGAWTQDTEERLARGEPPAPGPDRPAPAPQPGEAGGSAPGPDAPLPERIEHVRRIVDGAADLGRGTVYCPEHDPDRIVDDLIGEEGGETRPRSGRVTSVVRPAYDASHLPDADVLTAGDDEEDR